MTTPRHGRGHGPRFYLASCVPVSLSDPPTPLPLSPYNRTFTYTLPPNRSVFLWESIGKRTVVRGKGEGGWGGQTERRARKTQERIRASRTSRGTHVDCGLPKSRGKSSVGRRHAPGRLSGDACRRDDGLKTSQGSVSFCPSTHTHTQAKYHQPYRSRGGGASLHMGRWVGKLGEDIGRPEPEGW